MGSQMSEDSGDSPESWPAVEPGPLAMIATDIDGTMLRTDGSLSPRVKAAMAEAVSAGIHVVPTTGRPVLVAQDIIEASELSDYWIFANGAITRHLGRDELIRGFWMERNLTKRLVAKVREALPEAGFAVEFEKTVAFERGFADLVGSVPDVALADDVLEMVDSDHPDYERIQKILVFDQAAEIDDLFAAVGAAAGSDAVPSYSGLAFIELAASAVTKATALELLCEDLNIDRSQAATFGDNYNDLSMLEWAGRSYAMANAIDEAKRVAGQTVLSSDDDGLAVKIEELLAEL